MGAEPYLEALDRGAEVVVGGRSCEEASMEVPLWVVILTAIAPIPGLLAAIPMSILVRNDPGWVWLIAGPLLAYVQVLVVDFGWTLLLKWKAWGRLLERMRSPRVERLMASKGGSFWEKAGVIAASAPENAPEPL